MKNKVGVKTNGTLDKRIHDIIKNIIKNQKNTIEDDILNLTWDINDDVLSVIWESDEPKLASAYTNKTKEVVPIMSEKKSKYSHEDFDEAKLYMGDNDPKQRLATRDYFRSGSPRGQYDTGFFLNHWDDVDELTKKETNENYEKTIGKNTVEARTQDLIGLQNKIVSKKWMETGILKERIQKKTNDLVDYNRIARWDARFNILNDEGKKMFAIEDEKQYLVNKKWLEYLEKYVDAMLNGSLDEFLRNTP